MQECDARTPHTSLSPTDGYVRNIFLLKMKMKANPRRRNQLGTRPLLQPTLWSRAKMDVMVALKLVHLVEQKSEREIFIVGVIELLCK